jgi:hypothetical protein
MLNTLDFVLLLLAAAVVLVALFRSLNLPPVLGYLVVGALGGPNAMDLMGESEGARHLAEFGVVFLMFSIGLEFSLARLFAMKRIVFGLGAVQVLASIVLVTLVGWLFGLGWAASFALGGTLTMSSTAILSKLLADRMELDSRQARPSGASGRVLRSSPPAAGIPAGRAEAAAEVAATSLVGKDEAIRTPARGGARAAARAAGTAAETPLPATSSACCVRHGCRDIETSPAVRHTPRRPGPRAPSGGCSARGSRVRARDPAAPT